MKTKVRSVEPESLKEVIRWKDSVSKEILVLGFEEFEKRNHELEADFVQSIEVKRAAKSKK